MASGAPQDFLPFAFDSTPTFVLSIVAATLILAITFTKVWVSKIQRLQFLVSDYFVIASSLTLVASLGLIIYYVAIPLQGHYTATDLTDPEDDVQTGFLKAVFAVEILWWASLALSKLSILLLFRRVFFSMRLRVVTVFSMIYVVLLALVMILGTVFQCNPVQSFWHAHVGSEEPRCLDRQLFYLFSGIPNIFINIVIIVLPIYQIVNCQYQRTVKVFLWLIFLIGCTAVAASIVRFVEMAQIGGIDAHMARIGGGASVIVEATVVILCAYLPTLCPALWKMRPSIAHSGAGAGTVDDEAANGTKKSFRRRLLGYGSSQQEQQQEDSRFTAGRRSWPRPRPQSEYIDPNKSLPGEPVSEYTRSLRSLSSGRPQDAVLGGIRVDETFSTTVERRSRLYEQNPGATRLSNSFGTLISGPDSSTRES